MHDVIAPWASYDWVDVVDGLWEEDGRTFLNFKDRCSLKCELAVRNLKFEIHMEGRLRFKCGRYLRFTIRENCRYAQMWCRRRSEHKCNDIWANTPSLMRIRSSNSRSASVFGYAFSCDKDWRSAFGWLGSPATNFNWPVAGLEMPITGFSLLHVLHACTCQKQGFSHQVLL